MIILSVVQNSIVKRLSTIFSLLNISKHFPSEDEKLKIYTAIHNNINAIVMLPCTL